MRVTSLLGAGQQSVRRAAPVAAGGSDGCHTALAAALSEPCHDALWRLRSRSRLLCALYVLLHCCGYAPPAQYAGSCGDVETGDRANLTEGRLKSVFSALNYSVPLDSALSLRSASICMSQCNL